MAEAVTNADSGDPAYMHVNGGLYADEWYPYIQGHFDYNQEWELDVA